LLIDLSEIDHRTRWVSMIGMKTPASPGL